MRSGDKFLPYASCAIALSRWRLILSWHDLMTSTSWSTTKSEFHQCLHLLILTSLITMRASSHSCPSAGSRWALSSSKLVLGTCYSLRPKQVYREWTQSRKSLAFPLQHSGQCRASTMCVGRKRRSSMYFVTTNCRSYSWLWHWLVVGMQVSHTLEVATHFYIPGASWE